MPAIGPRNKSGLSADPDDVAIDSLLTSLSNAPVIQDLLDGDDSALKLTAKEQRVLDLWDELKRLQVEESLWKARQEATSVNHPPADSSTGTEGEQITSGKISALTAVVDYKTHQSALEAAIIGPAYSAASSLQPPTAPPSHRTIADVDSDTDPSSTTQKQMSTLVALLHIRDALALLQSHLLEKSNSVSTALAATRAESAAELTRVRATSRALGHALGPHAFSDSRRLDGAKGHGRNHHWAAAALAEAVAVSSTSQAGATKRRRRRRRSRTDGTDGQDGDGSQSGSDQSDGSEASKETDAFESTLPPDAVEAHEAYASAKTESEALRKEIRVMSEVIVRVIGEAGIDWLPKSEMGDGGDDNDGENEDNLTARLMEAVVGVDESDDEAG